MTIPGIVFFVPGVPGFRYTEILQERGLGSIVQGSRCLYLFRSISDQPMGPAAPIPANQISANIVGFAYGVDRCPPWATKFRPGLFGGVDVWN